ncbi:copper resistance protein B [Sphingorhabdus buctiana]|jgi:copper resistance protein B|uniref:Copper resistance protein B n=1 Tax=Sphingorhabdus buctiana TaxID=1508805 RepID=A0ABW4MEJ8_9SPHN
MSIARLLLAGIAALSLALPAHAQSMQGMDHSSMPGMKKPQKPSAKAPSKPTSQPPAGPEAMPNMDHGSMPAVADESNAQSATSDCPPEHAKMGHCTPAADKTGRDKSTPQSAAQAAGHDANPGMTMEESSPSAAAVDPNCPPEHAKMGHCTPRASVAPETDDRTALGTNLEPGNAPAPAPPLDWYADRIFSKEEMAQAREEMMKESGGTTFRYLSFDLAEYVVHKDKDSYRWDGEAWFGGDINRFVFKYEGEGEFGGPLDDLELFGLYSRSVSPYWNLQTGVRYDVKPDPSRTYAVIGVEGLAPYWFEITAAAFLSNKGEVRGRIEGYYDQRITQKLILQPRFEANLSAQSIPELGVGAGLTNLELGARLRYEIKKEFAPYVGVEWIRQFGETARFARASGSQVSDPHFVMGVRIWF